MNSCQRVSGSKERRQAENRKSLAEDEESRPPGGRGQPPRRPRQEDGSDATKAGGGNLHRGRGATALPGAKKTGDAIKAGGGNLHRGRGATAWGREDGGDRGRRGQTHEESESMPGAGKIEVTKAGGGKLTKNPSQCLGPRRWR